jgi:hypothetical protein
MRRCIASSWLVACLTLAACMSGDGMQEKLRDATRGYNGSVRWGDVDRAVQWLPVEAQQAFLARHEQLEDRLVIVDYQMTRLDLDRSNGVAASRAEIMWHTERELIVRTTRVDQLWQFHEGDFVLVDERRSGGHTLALFAEPGEKPHPFLPGLETYREEHEIGKENKKEGRRRRKRSEPREVTRPGPGTEAASFRP